MEKNQIVKIMQEIAVVEEEEEEAQVLVEEAIIQVKKMVRMKKNNFKILEAHQEDVGVEIKEEEVVAILNVIIATNLVI